jgi:hypothetical protein
VRFLGDASSSLGDATSSLGEATGSLGDVESSLGDVKTSLGDAESSLGEATGSLGDAESSLGEAKSSPGDAKSSVTFTADGAVLVVDTGVVVQTLQPKTPSPPLCVQLLTSTGHPHHIDDSEAAACVLVCSERAVRMYKLAALATGDRSTLRKVLPRYQLAFAAVVQLDDTPMLVTVCLPPPPPPRVSSFVCAGRRIPFTERDWNERGDGSSA